MGKKILMANGDIKKLLWCLFYDLKVKEEREFDELQANHTHDFPQ